MYVHPHLIPALLEYISSLMPPTEMPEMPSSEGMTVPCGGPCWDNAEEQEAETATGALEKFKTAVKNGMTAPAELREYHSLVCAKYPQFVKDYVADQGWAKPASPQKKSTLDQHKMMEILTLMADSRWGPPRPTY